ncbi:protein NETWORKED 4B-like [Punica granatum]|nr:protein NETWORKED 4B-like [Punica granatum]XP_031380077.1 protein NETWORKED 4B-like [Punica granatum]XP_031380078.1 protein NETWORKED 4B-like [Punica granatum]OWM69860.1 hypothetical protein CDL15_Pgr025709 [Punica granatum]
MERTESMKSNLKSLDTHFVPKISEWLAQNLQDMQQTSKQIMKLIEEDGNSAQEIDGCDLKKLQLLTLVQEFSSMYQSLADQYNQITGESQEADTHLELHGERQEAGEPVSQKSSSHATPEGKVQPHNLGHHHVGTDLSFSSGDGSFEASLKEGIESSSSSSSSSDSESEYFSTAINGYLGTVKLINGLGQQQKKNKPVIEPIDMNLSSEEVDADDSAKRSENGSYEELIGRIVQYEGELKALNLKLQQSEEHISQLKSALDKSEGAEHDLQIQLEAAKTEMEKKDADYEEAKGKVLQLEKQILESEAIILDSNYKTGILMTELKQSQEKLERSNEDSVVLITRLDSERQKIVELQERISMYQEDVSDRENEIMRLQNVCMEKEQLIMQWELRCKQLEESLRQHEDEKIEMMEVHHALVRNMQDHISNSKVAIEERETRIGSLNKEFDMMKLRHDTVVAERDGLNARIQAFLAEFSNKDNHINELTTRIATTEEVAGKLKLRVQELEEEVEWQKILILDGAEKKREAIRQLCFSLEHYRMGYHELREVFRGHKRDVLAL